MAPVHVAADLSFEVSGPEGDVTRGRLSGAGSRLTLDLDDPGLFAGAESTSTVRGVAEALAARSVVVRVVHRGTHLLTVGRVSAPWWHRRATGSRWIRVAGWKGAWTSLRLRLGNKPSVLPTSSMLPPATLFPVAPTFARRTRRTITTTHDPARGGGARLVLFKPDVWAGERQTVFWLDDTETTIGSDQACDVVLPGIEAHHATVLHDATDEFVIHSPNASTRVHGAEIRQQILRTGARVELGEHALAFFREEFADHGRPHGGRVGGEAGHQRSQPARSPDPARGGSGDWTGPKHRSDDTDLPRPSR